MCLFEILYIIWYAIHSIFSADAQSCPFDDWYRTNLRVTRATFLQIVNMLEAACFQHGHRIPAGNSFVDMPMSVSMTLAYLAQEGGFTSTASLFGVSKSTCIVNVNQVCFS